MNKTTFTATAVAATLFASASAYAETTIITPVESRPTLKGPEANFTGSVTVNPYYPESEYTGNSGALITFQPGARSAWHTHPAGQVLVVTSGTGWVQEEGGEKRQIRAGDVVWTPPGVKHWHGATDKNDLSHIAVSNVKDGKAVDWMEKVSDEQYLD